MNSFVEGFIFFVLGVFASVLVNLATPSIQRWMEERDLVNKKERQKALQEEYNYVKLLHDNSSRMIAYTTKELTIIFSLFSFGVLLIGTALAIQSLGYQAQNFDYIRFFTIEVTEEEKIVDLLSIMQTLSWIVLVTAYLMFLFTISVAFRIARFCRKVLHFDKYETDVMQRIANLDNKKTE